MRQLKIPVALFALAPFLLAQGNSTLARKATLRSSHPAHIINPPIPLHESSRAALASEAGGAFMSGPRCDVDGNLYLRKYAMDRPMLSPVVKIDSEGKRTAWFDSSSFSQLKLKRTGAFAPAADDGLYQIAAAAGQKPGIYVLRFSSDGSASSPILLDEEMDAYQFAPFPDGNLLVSGFRHDPRIGGQMRPLTAVFSADGRLLAHVSFESSPQAPTDGSRTFTKKRPAQQASPETSSLDLSGAEAGSDGNVYVMRARHSAAAMVDVISPSGKILRTLKIRAPKPDAKASVALRPDDSTSSRSQLKVGATPLQISAFHVSKNRVAVEFDDNSGTQTFVVTDAQSGREIATYSYSGEPGAVFACYSADEGVFTFLNLAEGNKIEVIRATAQD